MSHARRRYLRQLAQHRARLLRSVDRQRAALAYLNPEPAQLWSLVASERLWERRLTDADFAVVRVGCGATGPPLALVPPETKPLELLEPLSAMALRRFIDTYRTVPGLPLPIALTGFSRVYLRGDRQRVLGLVRALVAQLCVMHAPDDVRIAVCDGTGGTGDADSVWDWVKWLPHAWHPDRTDAAGPARLVAPTVTALEQRLADLLADRPRFDPQARHAIGPHLVVVRDGPDPSGAPVLPGGVEGVTVLDLGGAARLDRHTLALNVDGAGRLSVEDLDGVTELGRADTLAAPSAESLARRLAPLRLARAGAAGSAAVSDPGLGDLLGLGDPYSFDPERAWRPRALRDRLRVVFGTQADGTPVELDLKEASENGMGPHGLLIGATGSGKSELLRTLVLALAVTHDPRSLNFALIDFKGGATFARLDDLPHTSAVITNLENKLTLVDRMADALNGELIRRQELLRAAGDFSSVRDYELARAAGAPLPEVPTLLVICDEFSELLSRKPEFIDMFVQIGRVGRSLGVHLLLASQQLEEGRLRGLDGHLSYRIGLRTFSTMDSRRVLGVKDAAELTGPGHGYLRHDSETLVRFRSVYVSGAHRRTFAAPHTGRTIVPYTNEHLEAEATTVVHTDETGRSLLDILVDRLAGHGTPAHQVWLPPLDRPPALDELLGPVAADPVRGLGTGRTELHGRLKAVAGIVDRPLDQRRDPLEFDLAAGAGHLVVTGGPQSGRSTALRTVITSLALTHTPRETQFYCLDFGGGGLAALRGLPHVGGVAGRQHTGAVRRTVAEVAQILVGRERRFAEADIDGIAAYRAARAAHGPAGVDDPHGDVFLVIDGWLTLRREFADLEDTVCDLAARGLAYGVHLMVACARAFDLRPTVRDLFGSRIELRLGDPIDTTVDRLGAQRVPKDSPGRGLAATKHQMLLALPRADGVGSVDGLREATGALVRAAAEAWTGAPAPKVRLLPATLPYEQLPAGDEVRPTGPRCAIGLAEQDLSPVHLDFAADPHLLLLGDPRSGKTGFLRLLARRITTSCTPHQARLVVIDHRRGLLDAIDPAYLLGHGTGPDSTRALIAECARGAAERRPGPGVTAEQIRRRAWWRGPELFVLVDDYDLVAGPGGNPLQPLAEYLAQGRDLGLHVIVTRRTGGAARALFDPFLARVREVGSPGIQLAGDKSEGPLLGGVKPEPLPPGRGRLVAAGRAPQLLQLAWLPESPENP
jgi:DNA segregation ATPase FtsK/SpoIIIE, S-DNA-T family